MHHPSDTRDFDRAGLAELVIANNAEFLLAMGAASEMASSAPHGVRWTINGSPIAYHNAVVEARLKPEDAEGAIEEFAGRLTDAGLEGSWHLTEAMLPSDLGTRLLSSGFVHAASEPGMVHDGRKSPMGKNRSEGLQFMAVTNQTELSEWVTTLGTGFGEGPVEAAWVGTVYASLLARRDAAWTHILARWNGQSVGTISLFRARGVMGLYFVYVRDEFRGKGFGGDLVAYAVDVAASEGYRYSVLTASEAGARLYRNLAFTDVTTVDVYELPRLK